MELQVSKHHNIMKLLLLLVFTWPLLLQGQQCTTQYFTRSKQISTQQCNGEGSTGRDGTATAYNKEGKVIYTKNTRRYAGHASVHFTYYPNGAVQKAEYSDAPDAGIQWYREVTTFNTDGTITNVTKQSNDDGPSTYLRRQIENPATIPVQPKIIEPPLADSKLPKGAHLHSNELWVRNNNKYSITVKLTTLVPYMNNMVVVVPPKRTKKIIVYGDGKQASTPDTYYKISTVCKGKLMPIKNTELKQNKALTSQYIMVY
jgi:hypothetical protein